MATELPEFGEVRTEMFDVRPLLAGDRCPNGNPTRATQVGKALREISPRCFDQGNLATLLDYSRDPAIGLNDEDRRWVADLLKQSKKR